MSLNSSAPKVQFNSSLYKVCVPNNLVLIPSANDFSVKMLKGLGSYELLNDENPLVICFILLLRSCSHDIPKTPLCESSYPFACFHVKAADLGLLL